MIAFHGALDDVIPFYDAAGQNVDLSDIPIPPNQDYNSESYCTNNKTFQQTYGFGTEQRLASSLNLFYILARRNRFTELYLDCEMKHGLDGECGVCPDDLGNLMKNKKCTTCTPFKSDFGTGEIFQDPVTIYMAKRIAVFFQTIMAYTTTASGPLAFNSRGRSYFKECVNNRRCNQLTDNNECIGSDTYKLCDGTPVSFD